MKNENFDYRKYLLRSLSPEELEYCDKTLIEDPQLDAELRRAEESLIEEYIDKKLDPDDEELFFENFLISRRRFETVREIRLLRSQSPDENPAQSEGEAVSHNYFRSLAYLLALDRKPSLSVLGLLVIIFSVILIWQIFFTTPVYNKNLQALVTEVAKIDLSDIKKFRDYSALQLNSDQHAAGGIVKFPSKGLTSNILLRLALPPEASTEKCFSIEIALDENHKYSVDKIKAYANEAGTEIRLLVPREIAENKDCTITLKSNGSKLTPLNYHFRLD